jgi:hypothetical protein
VFSVPSVADWMFFAQASARHSRAYGLLPGQSRDRHICVFLPTGFEKNGRVAPFSCLPPFLPSLERKKASGSSGLLEYRQRLSVFSVADWMF